MANELLDQKLAVLRNWGDNVNKNAAKDPTAPFVPSENNERTPAIPSGSPGLDALLGGGIPRGKFTQIYGLESSGKSTLAYMIVAELHKRDPNAVAVLLDAEASFDPVRAVRMGIDLGDPRKPETSRLKRIILRGPAEPGLDQVLDLAQMPPVDGKPVIDLVVIDSIAALVPKAEFEADMEDQGMGLLARMISKHLRNLNAVVQASGTTVVLINQTRTKIGVMYGDPTVIPGGKALDFYPWVHIAVAAPKSEAIKNKDGEPIASTVHLRVKKNKVNGTIGEAIVQITPRDGLVFAFEAAKTGVKVGVVNKAGAFYSVKVKAPDGKMVEIKEQGEVAFMSAIRKLDESARQELYERIVKAGMEKREAFFVEESPEEAALQVASGVDFAGDLVAPELDESDEGPVA